MNKPREMQQNIVAIDYQSMLLEAERELAIIDYEIASENWELRDEEPEDACAQEN